MMSCCCNYQYYKTDDVACGCCPGNRPVIVNLNFLDKEMTTDCNPPNPGPCKFDNIIDWRSISGNYVIYPIDNFVDPNCPNSWRAPPDSQFPSEFFFRVNATVNSIYQPCPPCRTKIPIAIAMACDDIAFVLTVSAGNPFDTSECGFAGNLALQTWQYLENPRKICLPNSFKMTRPHVSCPAKTVSCLVSIHW